MDVAKQIAVVSGGASGLGRACVELLINKGTKVASWDTKKNNTAGNLEILCDVTDESQVILALDETVQTLGSPTICINCAGIAPAQKIVDKNKQAMPLADFAKVININLIGSFNVMRVVAAEMATHNKSQDSEDNGVIINTASIAAFEGQIGQTAYSAAKGGIVSMTLPAARELAKYGIRVNTIAPGVFETPMMAGMSEHIRASLAESVPFPKRLGQASEFANLALHIIENVMINGSVIRLDGALRMG